MLFSRRTFVFVSLTLIFLSGSFFIFRNIIFADSDNATADKILISEIKTAGKSSDGKAISNDKFIELYNPNNHATDLTGWAVKKKTKSGTENNILSNINAQIPAFGYFLIVPRDNCGDDKKQKCYLGAATPDGYYSTDNFLADDNSVILYNNLKDETDKTKNQADDKVGWGAASDFSGSVFGGNPAVGKSLERKITDGKMQDTKNNADDFFPQDSPNPQNSSVIRVESGGASGSDADNNSTGGAGGNNANDGNANTGTGNSTGGNTSGNADTNTNQNSGGENSSGNSNGQNGDSSSQTATQNTASSSQTGSSSGGGGASKILEQKVIVNELLINSSGDDGQAEFIELYNAGKDAVDLSKWSLEDQAGKTSKYIFPAGTKIDSGKYKVFYSSETKISLNNTGDGVILRDDLGNIISKTPISDVAKEGISFSIDENQKWIWTTDQTPGKKNVIKEIESKTAATKKTDNASDTSAKKTDDSKTDDKDKIDESLPADGHYDFSDGIIINEIFPNPPGRDNQKGNYEWVELYNPGDQAVNLKGWFLDDILDKGSKPFCFLEDRIIPAQGYLVVSSEESKISFNNTEEEVNLLWPDQTVVDSVSYKDAKEDFSYSLGADGSWFWAKEKTPGAKNAMMPASNKTDANKSGADVSYQNSTDFTEAENENISNNNSDGEVLDAASVNDVININKDDYKYVSIAEAKKLPPKTLVGMDGIVSVSPGVFGGNIFYIVDKNSGEGLQMFSYGGNLPALNLGNQIQVFGFLSEVGGEKRLVLDDNFKIETMSSDNLLNISSIKYADMESAVGNLVKVEGTAEALSGDIFLLDMAGGKLKVYAKPAAAISFGNLKAGDHIEVTGHLSRTSAGYRLLPRFSTDIRFLEKQSDGIMKIEGTKEIVESYSSSFLLNTFFVLSLLVLADWIRVRIKMRKKESAGMLRK